MILRAVLSYAKNVERKEKKMNKIQMIFVFIGIILSSTFIHELVHVVETGFQITEFCGLGWSKTNVVGGHTAVGWIVTKEKVNEVLAYSIEFVYILILTYFCYFKKGDEIE